MKKGFTLIELLIVIGIIVMLATVIIINVTQARMNGRDSERIADFVSLQLALETYFNKYNEYPSTNGDNESCIDEWCISATIPANTCSNYQQVNEIDVSKKWIGNLVEKYDISILPLDPLNKQRTGEGIKQDGNNYYLYKVYIEEGIALGYKLITKLETNKEAMKNDGGIYNVDLPAASRYLLYEVFSSEGQSLGDINCS